MTKNIPNFWNWTFCELTLKLTKKPWKCFAFCQSPSCLKSVAEYLHLAGFKHNGGAERALVPILPRTTPRLKSGVLVVSSPNLYPPCTLLPVLPPHPISKVSNFCGYLFCRWPNVSSLASLRCLPQVMCQQCRVWMNSSNSSYNSHRLCRGVFNNWCIAIGTDLLFLTRLIAHRGRFLL